MHSLNSSNPLALPHLAPSTETQPVASGFERKGRRWEADETGMRTSRGCTEQLGVGLYVSQNERCPRERRWSSSSVDSANDATIGTRDERVDEER